MASTLHQTDSKQTSDTDTAMDESRSHEAGAAVSLEQDTSKDAKNDVVLTEKEAQAKKEAEEDLQYPHGLKLWVILAALCLAVFLVALDQTIISTAIPKITDRFHSIKDIGW